MKLTALIMVGNVGSGKTTWIKKFLAEHSNENWVVVSKDALRRMVGGGEYIYNEHLEPFIDYMSKEAIKYSLQTGWNVIIDETNVSVISRAILIDLIQESVRDCIIKAVEMPLLTKTESLLRKARPDTNYGYSIEVWEVVWERKNSKYVEPHEYEGFDEVILIREKK